MYLFILFLLVMGIIFSIRYLALKEKKAAPAQVTEQQITLTGELVCLPHKDTTGPQTLECAFGVKNREGKYYALSELTQTKMMSLTIGETITVTGKLRPEPTSKYDIVGVMDIDSI